MAYLEIKDLCVRIKDKEIAAKIYDSDNKLKIAKANKNRHDK